MQADPPRDWRAALAALPDGAPVEGALLEALRAEITRRATDAGAPEDWRGPRLSGLRVRRDEGPEVWRSGANLLLRADDAAAVSPEPALLAAPPRGCLLALGAGASLHKAHLAGEGSILAVGDRANLYASTLSALTGAVVCIGEDTTSTWVAQLDARNGGAILVGADGMWAAHLRIMTDDMHAIRDVATGRRLNRYGGRVMIDRHVWLGEGVTVMGDARIGADSVVGAGAFVKGAHPANALLHGRPARLARSGVTWSRDDLP